MDSDIQKGFESMDLDLDVVNKYERMSTRSSRFKRILCPSFVESRLNTDSNSSIQDTESINQENEPDLNNNNLNQMDINQTNDVYCICRSSDQRFMIACDNCDEWYHGDCVGVKQFLSSKIKNFYCHICRQANKALKIKYENKFETFLKSKQVSFIDEEIIRFNKQNQLREKKESKLIEHEMVKSNLENSPNSKFYSDMIKLGYDSVHLSAAIAVRHELNEQAALVQCLGPGCVKRATEKSKYCSTKCGLDLAKKRLCSLPVNHEAIYANKVNETELKRIKTEINQLEVKLHKLNVKQADLNAIIERTKHLIVDSKIEKEREKRYIEFNCVTCGELFSEKMGLKHLEKCFNKIEMKSYFGSLSKSSDYFKSVLCDNYNPVTGLYCRRLKVMCPEHCDKDLKKVRDSEACGCPLPSKFNILEDSTNEFCLADKKTCSMHFKWEKTRKAQIDVQKLQIFLKLDSLMSQKRINEEALANRVNVFSLLLNQTIKENDFEMSESN